MHDRRGSFLLFSVALVGVMVAFGFALLQTVRLSTDAGTSSQRQWFAQESALAGLHHAMENIALDYRSSHRTATYLDGIWHRDFNPLGLDQNQPESAAVSADDDVRNEHILWQPILERNDRGYWEYGNGYGSFGQNMYQARGRARYYEVGYYEPSDPTYTDPLRPNMSAVRFTDLAASVPTRAGATFLDAQLRRLVPGPGETTDQLRVRARYRLRYAVLTMDAGSAILANPLLDSDYRDLWRPGTAATTGGAIAGDAYDDAHYAAYGNAFAPTAQGRRVERYADSLVNMLLTSGSAGERSNYLRLEQVFKLRGSSTNVAISQQGWPVTFPNMLRFFNSSGETASSWLASRAPVASGLGLFAPDNDTAKIRLEGGQGIRGRQSNTDFRLSHALVGPQYSYRNIQAAVTGGTSDRDWAESQGDPVQTRTLVTPFGRAGEKGTAGSAAQWNRGPTDVPWQINPLTAAPGVIRAMVGGYMPAQFRSLIIRYMVTESGVTAPSTALTSVDESGRLDGAYELSMFDSYGRNLFTDFMSPAFKRWPALRAPPQSPTGNFDVPPYAAITGQPDLYPNHVALDTRSPDLVYPGIYASLGYAAPTSGMEDTGKDINASGDAYNENSSGYGRLKAYDSHSANVLFVGTPRKYENNFNKLNVPMYGNLPIADSFFWDMSAAFGTAISVMRMHWLEASNSWVKLGTLFPAGKDPFGDMDSIADLDRLFLQQLGIDKDRDSLATTNVTAPDGVTVLSTWDVNGPASPNVIQSWGYDGPPSSFPRVLRRNAVTLSYNIAGLVKDDKLATGTYTSKQRARCMELMLNDWRMSFLGSSPDYFAAFRPLDFDGDGYALCSAYSTSYTFPDAVSPTWPASAVVNPADPLLSRQGRALNASTDHPFSLTGCFVMGKSRYYRVITRGELWDCQLARPVSNATLESVLCVDPNGLSAGGKLGQDFAVLHQRWYWNSYNALLPSIYP
ncbi:MAG: hypothetical protein J0M02_02430 [Planctomycetes bacterium]|nr:hypothetical protein [Planctomycetota bacterium]